MSCAPASARAAPHQAHPTATPRRAAGARPAAPGGPLRRPAARADPLRVPAAHRPPTPSACSRSARCCARSGATAPSLPQDARRSRCRAAHEAGACRRGRLRRQSARRRLPAGGPRPGPDRSGRDTGADRQRIRAPWPSWPEPAVRRRRARLRRTKAAEEANTAAALGPIGSAYTAPAGPFQPGVRGAAGQGRPQGMSRVRPMADGPGPPRAALARRLRPSRLRRPSLPRAPPPLRPRPGSTCCATSSRASAQSRSTSSAISGCSGDCSGSVEGRINPSSD